MEADKGSPEAVNPANDAGDVVGGGRDPGEKSAWQGKSCKGCLYYSSILKSKDRNPRCVGFTRTLKHVPEHIIGESEMEATREGRALLDFRYACLGYSIFLNSKAVPMDQQGNETQLPFCAGLELLIDKRTATADQAATHVHNKEDMHHINSQREPQSAHSAERTFYNKFHKSAGVVATGVSNNLLRVGRFIKNNFEDILFDRDRPK